MSRIDKRLAALEKSTAPDRPRFPDLTPALMLVYGTPAEQEAWEAAGKSAVTRAEWEATLDQVYGHPMRA